MFIDGPADMCFDYIVIGGQGISLLLDSHEYMQISIFKWYLTFVSLHSLVIPLKSVLYAIAIF